MRKLAVVLIISTFLLTGCSKDDISDVVYSFPATTQEEEKPLTVIINPDGSIAVTDDQVGVSN